ncbi:potassium channel protein [Oscillatoria sp. FACHB-1406]|nr:potassium channel protein [Oscillatoria sp. FACHB-1406]
MAIATSEQQYHRLRKQLSAGVAGLAGIFLMGTLWYSLVEKWTWIDAAYMTTITLATVGYSETHPLSERSRLFTIWLIAAGILSIGYIANRFTEALIQGYFQEGIRQQRRRRAIENFKDHYILCSYGRMGYQIALEFEAENIPFVIIESDISHVEDARQHGYIVIQGDATLDECLIQAGISRAVCVVAALPSDAENLYTILSAKALNPNIRAIARASSEEAIQKLKRVGANAVVSPYVTGGRRLAAAALRPQVMDFVDGIITGTDRSFFLDEFILGERSPCIGHTLRDAKLRVKTGALVLAIRRADGKLIGGPSGETVLAPGDLLICMGTSEQLHALNQLLMVARPY